MIEVFDRVLQFLEHVLLPLAVTRDVGDRPHRVFGLALALAERTHPQSEPAALLTLATGDADFFLLALALARRLQKAEHRFRHIGIADEDPLNRAHLLRARGTGEREIGRVGIGHVTAGVGDRDAVMGEIRDPADHRIVDRAIGEADDAGGESEQTEQADHRKQRQQPQNIRLRLDASDGRQRHGNRDDASRHHENEEDAAAPPRRLVGSHRLS